jgi:3-ketosteroid 9alpha-monooxygenase subunit A
MHDFPPFPQGWFHVASSHEVTKNEIRSLRFLGRDLITFRDESNRARVFDAHCPHLGAHIGKGGTIANGRVTCPFHGWTFDGTGSCVAIPHCDRIPGAATLRAFAVSESQGQVFIWHGLRDAKPTFQPVQVPELGARGWTRPVSFRERLRGQVHYHTENLFDGVHFVTVHGLARPLEQEVVVRGPIARFNLSGGAFSYSKLPDPLVRLGSRIEFSGHVTAFGPGMALTVFEHPLSAVLLITHTPIDAEFVQAEITVAMRNYVPGVASLANRYFLSWARETARRDWTIFSHRLRPHARLPVLSKNDAWVQDFRAWYAQFCPADDENPRRRGAAD